MLWRPEDLAGTTVGGRYRVVRLLGKGGMGAVFEAVQVDLGRRVALKVLHPLLGDDEVLLHRLRREAVAAASLGHRNVVQVTDLSVQPGGFAFLVMELLEGRTLKQALSEEGPFTVERTLAIAGQVGDALEAAHAAGIVHRDIKPGNVMVLPFGQLGELVKVLDFGVARLREGPGYTRLTRAGSTVGTPSYMSPEQARGDEVDGRSDVHGLGALVFALLTGRPPYEGKDVAEVLVHIVYAPPPSLAAARPDVPPALDALVSRCLAKDRAERPASAAELAAALRGLRGGARPAAAGPPASPTTSRPVPRTEVFSALDPAPASRTAPTAPSREVPRGTERGPAGRRRSWPMALGLAVGLPVLAALAGLAIWLLWPADGGGAAPGTPGPAGPPDPAPFSGSLEMGSILCRAPHRLDLQDRELRGSIGYGLALSGPCELHCLRCTLSGEGGGLTASNGARAFLESSRVQGGVALSAFTRSTVEARGCEVRGQHAVSASSGATVLVSGGSISGDQTAIVASDGARVEVAGATVTGLVWETSGGAVVRR